MDTPDKHMNHSGHEMQVAPTIADHAVMGRARPQGSTAHGDASHHGDRAGHDDQANHNVNDMLCRFIVSAILTLLLFPSHIGEFFSYHFMSPLGFRWACSVSSWLPPSCGGAVSRLSAPLEIPATR
jgi:hypothetical protein